MKMGGFILVEGAGIQEKKGERQEQLQNEIWFCLFYPGQLNYFYNKNKAAFAIK